MFNVRSIVSILFGLLLVTAAAFAQVETGQIAGTVTDESGAVVPNARVTVTNIATNAQRTTLTSPTGSYIVASLLPATYQVSVSAGQFRPFTSNVEVTVGGRVTLDAKLSVNATVTEVQVVAEGGAQVNTQTQEISQVIDSEQVMQLPSLTRNPYDFIAISGNISNGDAGSSGSSSMGTNSQNSTTRGVGYNINGQRSAGTEILLDGVENVTVFGASIGTFIPLDSMQEYRVSTSNFEAQFGRASGGVVNVTTKTGTNNFHGDAWEYNRLSAYTSNTVTNSQSGLPKGTYTRNQFGFTVGGPLKRDKLFLFGGSEWIRVRSSAVLTSGVPTPEFLSVAAPNIQDFFNTYGGGKTFNFSQTFTAGDVMGSEVPAGLDPATPMFGIVPFTAPSNAGGGIPQNTYNYIIRGDFNVSSKTSMFFRFVDYKEVDESGSIFASPYSQYNVGQTENNQAYLFSLTHTFSPTLISSTKLSFSRFNTFQSYDTKLQNTPTLFVGVNVQVPGTSAYTQLPGFYNTNPGNGGLPFGGPQNTPQINQDLSWLKGKHSMQFGTQLLYIQDNQSYGAYAQAVQQLGNKKLQGFQNLYTGDLFEFQAAVDPKGALPCVRNPYTGDLTPTAGCSITLPAVPPSFARSLRYRDWAVYAQDSFKVTPKFTWNYGVRYEYYGVQHNNKPELDSNFYYGTGGSLPQNIRTGQVFTVPNSPIHGLWNPTYGAVSPRVGFAFDVFGDGRDSIRGGYGIAYERNFGNVTFNVIQNPPNYAVVVVNNVQVTTSNAGPLGGSAAPVTSPCYPAACLPPTSLRHVDQNIHTAQTQFWSLAVEHQFTHTSMMSVQYLGARGIHLYDIKNYNGLGSGNVMLGDPIVDPVTGNAALTRLNPQYSNINNRGSEGDSYYQAGNVQFQTSNLHRTGMEIVANYTLSRAIDNLSSTFSESNNAFSLGYTNPFNPSLDRGNGDLDVRHRLVLAPIYQVPYFRDQRSIAGEILGNWQVAGIYQVHSGSPFSYYDLTNNYSGYNIARYTPDGPLPKRTFKSIPSGTSGGGSNLYQIGVLPGANAWANPAFALVNPPNGISDWGPWPLTMTGRNTFRGPGFWNVDLSISKRFPIREHVNLEFRAEGFNILNHHNLFLQQATNDASSNFLTNPDGTPAVDSQGNLQPLVNASKGGIGNNGGANDERRFGQFALKVNF